MKREAQSEYLTDSLSSLLGKLPNRCNRDHQLQSFYRSLVRSISFAGGFDSTEIIYNNFCKTKAFTALSIPPLQRLEKDMVRSRWIGARHNGIVIMRIKRLADALFRFNPVLVQETVKLLEGHLHALKKLIKRCGRLAAHGALEVVDDW